MNSATRALLWEIWCLNRQMIAAVVGLTVAGRLFDAFSPATVAGGGNTGMSAIVVLLLMTALLLLFGVFNYTEPSDGPGVGGFPSRLFILPVSSIQLVTVPMLAGIVAVELLYVAWMGPLSRSSSTSPAFVATLIASLMVFYQAGLWTLHRLGALRMLVIGAAALIVLGVGVSPSFPPHPVPAWRSEGALAGLVAGVASITFFLAVRHVRRSRCGGMARISRLDGLIALATGVIPVRRRPFGSPAAAQFWFEWRCAGLVLPMLVGGVLLAVIGPLSWIDRHEASRTLPLLVGVLVTPIILAIPIGFGFGKPTFWSDELSLPAFVAIRPLTGDDITAIKVRVALASAAASWLVVLLFAGAWLSMWASLGLISGVASDRRLLPAASIMAVGGAAIPGVLAGMLLTWRFLVSRLWTGLSGDRRLFSASVLSVFLMGVIGMVAVAAGLPEGALSWVAEDAGRIASVARIVFLAVAAKCALAVYSWRRVAARYVRQYLILWAGGTLCFVAVALAVCEVARLYGATEIDRFQTLVILLALLAMPVGRLGLAPALLARNRHR